MCWLNHSSMGAGRRWSMREAILTAVTVPATAEAPNGSPDTAPAGDRVTVHAIALRALLTEARSALSPAERKLLSDWLERLATTRSHPTGSLRRAHLDRGRVR